MDAGRAEIEMTLKDLEMEITCCICHDHYTEPKMLPCFHYYCKKCIHGMANRTGSNRPFSCPECREKTTVAEGKEEELKPACIVNRLKSMYYKHKKALRRQDCCEFCGENQEIVEVYCQQCDKFACQRCAYSHFEEKTAMNHDVVSINRYNTTKIQEIVSEAPLQEKCPNHKDALKTYCYNCDKNICGECIVYSHNGHKLESIVDAAKKMKDDIEDRLDPLRKGQASLSNALKDIHKIKQEIESQRDSTVQAIEISFLELRNILETRERQLLEEVSREVKNKMEMLGKQEENLFQQCTATRRVLEDTENSLQCFSDHEVTRTNSEMKERLKEQLRACEAANATSQPVESPDINVEVSCAEELKDLCHRNAKISYFKVITMPEKIPLGKESAVEFFVKNSTGNLIASSLNVVSQMKCQHNGALVKTKTLQVTPNKYRLVFKPSHRGRHDLSIKVNGKPATKSPLSLLVSITPTQFEQSTLVCTLSQPCKIVVNSLGHIIVAEYKGNIVVIDRNGKILRKIIPSQHQMKQLESLAVDGEDNIFFVDGSANRLGKCDRNGDDAKVCDIKQLYGPGYKDLTIVDDELLVIEQNNQGLIEVYDQEFRFLRHIAGRSGCKLRCLHSDSQSKLLYVTDNMNTVQVLSKTGYLLHSIGYNMEGVQKLCTPWMVHVHDQFVYVADHHHLKTVVFTTDGQYVTMFGKYGAACVDHDGFFYLCYVNDIYCY